MNELADAYGAVTARYYDRVYEPARAPTGDVAFYLELAREAAGPVLELGCGTGRVLLPIAALGIPCSGVDISPRMLDALRRKDPPPTLRLALAPVHAFDLGPDRFTLIFAAFRVLQHLYTEEEQLACLECVKRHLAPGSRFAFDVFNPDPARIAAGEEPEREDARFEADGEKVVRYTRARHDAAARRTHVRLRYERSCDGEVLGSDTVELSMRWFTRDEIERLLARAGFRHVATYGDFSRGPCTPAAPEIIAIASR